MFEDGSLLSRDAGDSNAIVTITETGAVTPTPAATENGQPISGEAGAKGIEDPAVTGIETKPGTDGASNTTTTITVIPVEKLSPTPTPEPGTEKGDKTNDNNKYKGKTKQDIKATEVPSPEVTSAPDGTVRSADAVTDASLITPLPEVQETVQPESSTENLNINN